MDDKEIRNIWITAIICATIIVCSLIWVWKVRTAYFTENGYTRQTLQGYDMPQWVLVDPNKVEN